MSLKLTIAVLDTNVVLLIEQKFSHLTERTIIITGASGGLGKTVAELFLQRGFRVVAPEEQDVDLTDEGEAGAYVADTLRSYKIIDSALLLVGGFMPGEVNDTKSADLEKMFRLNFLTAFHIAKPLHAHMMQNGKGRIVLIGARPALVPALGKHAVAYALTKGLLFHLADILNAEAKGKDVVTHVVAPSTIDTPANRKSMPGVDPTTWVSPAQLAEIFYFICTDGGAPLREPVWKVYGQA